jgi:hypothetical protein
MGDMSEQEQKKKQTQSSKGTVVGYKVFAKVHTLDTSDPVIIEQPGRKSQKILTDEWQEVRMFDVPPHCGLPNKHHHADLMHYHELYSRPQAVGLAYQFAAIYDKGWFSAIDIKIVAHEIEYTLAVFKKDELLLGDHDELFKRKQDEEKADEQES